MCTDVSVSRLLGELQGCAHTLWQPAPRPLVAALLRPALACHHTHSGTTRCICLDAFRASLPACAPPLCRLTSLQLLDILSPSVPGQGLVMRACELAK